MNYVRFHCPVCNHLLVVPPEAAGMSGPCPNCHTIIQGPNQPVAAPQPQPLNPPQEQVPNLYIQSPQSFSPQQVQPETIHPSPPGDQSPPSETVPPDSPSYANPAPSEPLQSPPPASPSPDDAPFPEPEPALTAKHPLSPGIRSSGISFGQAFALCFFASLLFFVLGFVLGKSGAVNWDQILAKTQKQKEAALPEEDPAPAAETPEVVIPIAPLESTPLAQAEETTTASATLETFLLANNFGARNAYVLYPKAVLPMMAASAEIHGDGPILFESITLQSEEPNLQVFWIKTSEYPFPFSVAMIKEGDWWLVDWMGFADFYYDRLGAFARGREGAMVGTFRVLLKAAPGETSPLSPSRCLVRAPQSSLSYQVNSLAESPARRKLAEIFQAYQQGESDQFKDAMASDGIPLILEISRTGAENPTLKLEKVISTAWPPLSVQQMQKDPLSRFY